MKVTYEFDLDTDEGMVNHEIFKQADRTLFALQTFTGRYAMMESDCRGFKGLLKYDGLDAIIEKAKKNAEGFIEEAYKENRELTPEELCYSVVSELEDMFWDVMKDYNIDLDVG